MTISTLKAAKTMAKVLNWNVTNLELQKMLYIAHLFFFGRTGRPLIQEDFEAWDYGPVLPSLYRELKFFGSDTIMNIFPAGELDENSDEFAILKETASHLKNFTAGQLVNITHHPDGAWYQHYKPNIRNIIIDQKSIKKEYEKLYKNSDE